MDKDVKTLIAAARAAGWAVQPTTGGHTWLVPPDPAKPRVLAQGTSGDRRAARNLRAQLRRSGLEV